MTPSEAKAAIKAGRHVNAALVLSGGSAPGICSGVGYLKGLLAAGFDFAELSGTSAGAVATGLFASSHSIEECEARLRAIPKDAVVPSWWQELKMHTCGSVVCDESDAALLLLRANVAADWASLRYPCHWWTSRLGSPSVWLIPADCLQFQTPAEAIRASMAIPFVLPCVQGLDGNRYVDGGLRFNVPIIPDWEDRFDIVFVCINTPEETFRPINKDLNAIQQAKIVLDSILEAQNDAAKEHCADDNNLVYFRLPPWPVELNDLIFNFDLIDAAASQVAQWMQEI
jgi:predicted acylesterase/phospholipase RssA